MNLLSFKYCRFSVNTIREGVKNRANKDWLLFCPPAAEALSPCSQSIISMLVLRSHFCHIFLLQADSLQEFLDLILVYHPLTRSICS